MPTQLSPESCKACNFIPFQAPTLTEKDTFYTREFENLLRSSCSPSDLQTSQVAAHLECVTADIEGIQAQLDHLAAHVRELQEQKSKLGEIARDCRSVLAPIRLLPAEILHSIFSEVCLRENAESPGESDTSSSKPIEKKRYPWTLASVSSSWRQIVNGNKTLWTNIHLNLDPVTRGRGRTMSLPDQRNIMLRRLRLHLQRSGNCHLIVALQFDSKKTASKPQRVLIDTLASQSNRISTLRVTAPENLLPALAKMKGSLAALKLLQITDETISYWGGQDLDLRLDVFLDAPNLQKVVVDGCRSALPLLPLSSPNLQELCLNSPASRILDIFHTGSHLEVLSLTDIAGQLAASPSPGKTLSHSRLRVLSLGATDSDWAYVAQNVRLPSLKCLIVIRASLSAVTSAKRLLEESRCSLNVLHIEFNMKQPADSLQLHPHLTSIFQNASMIQHLFLSFNDKKLLVSTLELLSLSGMLPNLQTMRLGHEIGRDILFTLSENLISFTKCRREPALKVDFVFHSFSDYGSHVRMLNDMLREEAKVSFYKDKSYSAFHNDQRRKSVEKGQRAIVVLRENS